jgi:hypothetical protein
MKVNKIKMNTLCFGKYKNHTYDEVWKNDRGYCMWILNRNSTYYGIKDFKIYLENKLKEEEPPVILPQQWWHEHASSAEILMKYGLEPDHTIGQGAGVYSIIDNNSIELDSSKCLNLICKEDIKDKIKEIIHELQSKKYECNAFLINNQSSVKINIISPIKCELSYIAYPQYFHSENSKWRIYPIDIILAVLTLMPSLQKQKELDKINENLLCPSKIQLSYWLYGPSLSNPKLNRGKWTLFFDKILCNLEGNTALDIAHQQLAKNYKQTPFKTSTARINPNATGETEGVIVIYCNESDRDIILQEIADIIPSIKGKKCYWKYHTDKYSKNGVKASNHMFIPS